MSTYKVAPATLNCKNLDMVRARSICGLVVGAVFVLACSHRDDTAERLDAGSGRGGAAAHGGVSANSGKGGGSSQGGRGGGGGQSGGAGQSAVDRCADAALTWHTGNKTNYTSYPEPGSAECIEFSGCKYRGMFAACEGTKSEDWVSKHNIVAIFPDLRSHELHDLCLRKVDGSHAIIVTVYDTCSDSDCDGCCTQNRGNADALIDVEHYTDERWGVDDGSIMWADLGPTAADGCKGD